MKSHARAVVIGGGVAGASTLYHLTKLGWSDVVLVEKNELTSGSTWMAAGNVPQFARSYNMTKVHNYPVELYPTLEEETGQHTGWHRCGSLRIALDPERMLEYRHAHSKDQTLGINSRIVSPDECKEIYPLIDTKDILGAIFHPDDGHVDPASVTQAMAKGAKMRGAEIYRFTQVTGLSRTPAQEWIVETDKGNITCEYVINCGGLWAKQLGAMAGLNLPIIPMEHQHILFGDVPDLKGTGLDLPLLRDPDTSYYMRQEHAGLLIGPYETDATAWHADGVPWDYAAQSLPTNLDRINEILMAAINRVPVLEAVGIQHEVNGPITYTPDGVSLVGPAFGVPNYFINAGHNFGITECATFGLFTAEWVIHGESSIDMGFCDPRRYGDYATSSYTYDKIMQTYRMMYAIEFPYEERPAARNIKSGPIYELLKEQGCSFGQTYGWERPNWFAPEGTEPVDQLTFKRGNWHDAVAAECKAVREKVGLLDLSGFAKYEVHGPGAEEFLNYLSANTLPKKTGQIKLGTMLDRDGHFKCDTTITRLGDDRFYVVSAAAMEKHDLDWMLRHMPQDGSVMIDNVTTQYGAFVLSGPNSRELLSRLTESGLSNQDFPFMTMQNILIGHAPARALRISFVGELGWELHHPIEYQRHIYEALRQAGQDLGFGNFGLRAMNSLRLEKGYLVLGGEFNNERTPLEAEMDRFLDFDKGEFLGRQALMNQKEEGIKQRLVLIKLESDEADTIGDEPVFIGERIVGRVASGAYSHTYGSSLASAFLDLDAAGPGTKVMIPVFGTGCQGEVLDGPLHDPKNQRLRS